MEKAIFEIASKLSTPLLLSGFLAAAFFFILKQILSKKIFPVLTKTSSSEVIKLIINRLFVLSLLAAILGFAGYIVVHMTNQHPSPPHQNTAESAIIQLKHKVEKLRGVFESIDDYGEIVSQEVREKAPKLARQFLEISDENIKSGYKIAKYEYAAYAFAMAASVETDDSEAIFYADQAIRTGNKTIRLIEKAMEDASNGGKYDRMVRDWIDSSREKERSLYTLAISYAIKARKGDPMAFTAVKKLLDEIPSFYKERYLMEKNEDLKWFLEKQKEMMNESGKRENT